MFDTSIELNALLTGQVTSTETLLVLLAGARKLREKVT